MINSFEARLAKSYSTLSEKLKQAADFVVAHPLDVATRSLRAISVEAGLAPVTFTRMARAIGYESYEEFREVMRSAVGENNHTFLAGVERLQNEPGDSKAGFFARYIASCSHNLQTLGLDLRPADLEHVVERLHASRQVLVSGALGSSGIAEYLSYMANFIAGNWHLAGRAGMSLGSSLIGVGDQDTLIVITKPPFADISIQIAEVASSQGAFVIVITDTYRCPALVHASASFIVPTESPHFFSSYVSTLALAESLVGMLAARAGPAARERIGKIEEANCRLEYLRKE